MTENNPAVVDPVTEIVTTSAVATIAVLATTVVAVTQYILRRAAKTKHVHCGSNTRVPSHSAGCHELYLNSEQAARCMDAAGSISLGTSILRIDALAADAECALLLKEAEAAVEIRSRVRACAGAFSHRQPRFRMPVVNFLVSKSPGLTLCDAILRRALVRISEAVPGLVAQQLGEAAESSFHNIIGNRALQFSEGEPAVNVYYAGGEFSPHEDKQRLTVLLALSDAASGTFSGGGTAFWSKQESGSIDTHAQSAPPSVTVHAPAGSALIFCGEVTHGALPVISGQRAVFVASFGPVGADYRHPSRISMGEWIIAAARRHVAQKYRSWCR